MSSWFKRGAEKKSHSSQPKTYRQEPQAPARCEICLTNIIVNSPWQPDIDRPYGQSAGPSLDLHCARCKKPETDWTEDELDDLKRVNIEQWIRIKRIKDQHENNLQAREMMRLRRQQDEELAEQKRQHQKMMRSKRDEIQHGFDSAIQKLEYTKAEKMAEADKILLKRQMEHEATMKKLQENHEMEMEEKKKKIGELKEETAQDKKTYEEKVFKQECKSRYDASELEKELKMTKKEVEQKIAFEDSQLSAQLSSNQEEFERKMEEDRLKMEREFEEAFQSNVTTELELMKEDGSTLRMRETEPGFVSAIASNLHLLSDPLDNSSEK